MVPENISLTIPSHPKYLQVVRSMIAKVTQLTGFSNEDGGVIILAVDEACSNIIKHSYMNDPSGKIDIVVSVRETEMEITIEDFGPQCDLNTLKSRDIEDIKPGGLGIYIMNSVMDSVTYDCSSEIRNQVKMIKKFRNKATS